MMGAIESITSYPETYRQMRLESLEQAGHGIDQIKAGVSFGVDPSQEAGRESASGAIDLIKGVGNATLGTLDYITSPVNAAIRTAVGKPAQDLTGIPAEYTDFATSLALPGAGFTRGGGGLVSGVRRVAAEKTLASKSANLYNPPQNGFVLS